MRSEHAGDAHVIELIGELDLDGAPRLEEELRSAEAGDAILDRRRPRSARVHRLDRPANARDGRRAIDGGTLLAAARPKQVHRVFEITDLVERLPFADA